jgi:hypothetical protein
MTTLNCLGNVLMVKFVDSTGGHKGQFASTAGYGIQIAVSAQDQKKARWAEVMAKGPKVDGLEIGDYVLLKSMMWMEGNSIDGEKWNKTDPSQVLAATSDKVDCQFQ